MINWKACCSASPAAGRGAAWAAACLGIAAALTGARARELPERPAYVEMLNADRLRDAAETEAAIRAYRSALHLFLRLQEERPDYKAEAIRFRIAYCREQIAALQGAPVPEEPVPPDSLPGPDSEDRFDRLSRAFERIEEDRGRMKQEILAQAERIRELEGRLEAAAAHAAEPVEAERENDALRERIAVLETSIESLRAQRDQTEADLRLRLETVTRSEAEARQELDAARRRISDGESARVPDPAAEPGESLPDRLARMDALLRAGRLDEADTAARQVLEGDARQPEAHLGLARIALARGRRRDARDRIERLAGEWPDHAPVQHFAGVVRHAEQGVRQAIPHFERAARLQPQNADYRRDLAAAYAEAGRRPEAVEAYREVIRLDPADGTSRFNLAVLLLRSGRLEDRQMAEVLYRKAIELGEPPDERLERRLEEQ